MTVWAKLDGSGLVVSGGSVPSGHAIPDDCVALPLGIGLGQITRYFWTGAGWMTRPMMPAPVETAEGWAVDALPDGAQINIIDADTGALEIATGLSGALPQNGDFQITVSGEPPWLSQTLHIRRGTGSEIARQADLKTYRAASFQIVADALTQIRRALITDLPGQEMIYLAKEAEAKAFIADPEPDLAQYPLLEAETGITAPTAAALAAMWIGLSAAWRSTAATLEKVRMVAKDQIYQANSRADIDAAVAAAMAALSVEGQ